MSKFRRALVQRRGEVNTQWKLFLAVFNTEVVKEGISPEQIGMLQNVMWAAWRACAYTNGIISEPGAGSNETSPG